MADPWLVPVRAVRAGASRVEHRSAPLGRLVVTDTVVPADAPVDADVILVGIDGGVEVSGRVSAPYEATCRRCTRPVPGRLEAEVRELYRPRDPRRRPDEEDEETYELGADHLDLAPLARDAVLLALPVAPLCREDCAGLCDRCGADRNEEPCTCVDGPVDDRWAVLDALRPPPGAAPPPSSS